MSKLLMFNGYSHAFEFSELLALLTPHLEVTDIDKNTYSCKTDATDEALMTILCERLPDVIGGYVTCDGEIIYVDPAQEDDGVSSWLYGDATYSHSDEV